MVGLRRWMLDLEWTLGAFDQWTSQFIEEWSQVKRQPAAAILSWLEASESKATTGRLMLGYLSRVMDGQLPGGLEEWHDLSLQGHQLGASLYHAVIGLEVSLRWARSGGGSLVAATCSD